MEHSPSHPTPEQIQADIDVDGGLYDQAIDEDAYRTVINQEKAYDSYKDNITTTHRREHREARQEAWREVGSDTKEAWESIGRVSKETARAAGYVVLREVMPFATEFMQRRTMNARRKQRARESRPWQSAEAKYKKQHERFTGSVDDFRAIRRQQQAAAANEKNAKRQYRAEQAGSKDWDAYVDTRRDLKDRRRTLMKRAIKSSLPLWVKLNK